MAINNANLEGRAPAVTSWNGDYVDDLYDRWKDDPQSLSESWQIFFQGFEMAMCPRACVASSRADKQSKVANLIYAYRTRGHLAAHLNPLDERPTPDPGLSIGKFGFDENDLDEVFDTGHLGGPKRAKLRDIIRILKETYCGTIGVQYTHIQSSEIRRWLEREMEARRNKSNFDREKKLEVLERLIDAEMFETFIQTRYPGQKRFSLEGAETLIPAIHAVVESAPVEGIEEIVLGMAHRGRLNVLANILDKSYAGIFTEFEGNVIPDAYGGDGDVKYHKGFSSVHRNRFRHDVHLSLTANPSHLEAVDPVVEGKVRAKQRQHDDTVERKKILPLLVHGDAAFIGQGLVAETLNLSQLKGYRTGGTLHIIINNQIGFTTSPQEARSTAYCTDVAKMIGAPVFHVNGDDPEATVYATELALRFRQEFGRDVIVDMFCYRRHGHDEGDEPAFTQPILYKKIKSRPSVMKLYTKALVAGGDLNREEASQIADNFQSKLQHHFKQAKSKVREVETQAFDALWQGLEEPFSYEPVVTAVPKKDLVRVAKALTTVPDDFNLNRKIARHLPGRLEAVEKDKYIDWTFAESLAFGSLLTEGTPVRLSGQDSQRGTFSQRHAVWFDGETGEEFIPLNHIGEGQARFCVYNSPLSEASVLGFEYGYSLAEPRMLVLWEAQFGDFVNGAQVIIDQFLVSSQSKWQRTSGMVLLLPHGYEGQGAEHSNAYLERYLAACAQENIQVCNLSTPAQYFHALRRQMMRPFRRPLIIMAPKSMLRNKRAVSPVSDLIEGRFEPIIDDPNTPLDATRLVICSGKLFHDLEEAREKDDPGDVAVIRIEQFYPLCHEQMLEITSRYTKAEEIIWTQEEPKNRGGWSFISPWLRHLFPDKRLRYIGRGYAASPATGSLKRHREEQEHIVNAAIYGDPIPHDVTILPEGAAA